MLSSGPWPTRVVVFALGPDVDACLPGAHTGPDEIARADDKQPLVWPFHEPQPQALLDHNDRTDLVRVDGECDPRDSERIAARAAAQTCDGGERLPLRVLCGPVPFEFDPWEPAGCVYAVASDNGCQY